MKKLKRAKNNIGTNSRLSSYEKNSSKHTLDEDGASFVESSITFSSGSEPEEAK